MSEAGVQSRGWGVPCLVWGRGYTVKSNASLVMVTWDPHEQTDMTENISFSEFHWRVVMMISEIMSAIAIEFTEKIELGESDEK